MLGVFGAFASNSKANALQPQIVGSTGAAQKLRLELDVDDDAEEAETGIPRDIRCL